MTFFWFLFNALGQSFGALGPSFGAFVPQVEKITPQGQIGGEFVVHIGSHFGSSVRYVFGKNRFWLVLLSAIFSESFVFSFSGRSGVAGNHGNRIKPF